MTGHDVTTTDGVELGDKGFRIASLVHQARPFKQFRPLLVVVVRCMEFNQLGKYQTQRHSLEAHQGFPRIQ